MKRQALLEDRGVSQVHCDYPLALSGLHSTVYGMWLDELLTSNNKKGFAHLSLTQHEGEIIPLYLPTDFLPDFTLT